MVKGEAAASNKKAALLSEKAFVDGLAYLDSIPLSTPDIRALLQQARAVWETFSTALADGTSDGARQDIARSSETLSTQFDELTGLYERSMQMLMQ